MVFWLMGISGAGKTTLGRKLVDRLKADGHPAYLIDGDLVRDFFDRDLGYSRDERKQNIKRILLAAHVLSQNGTIPVVCNIFPFEELRLFARKKIPGFRQVYLERDIESCAAQDVKGVYRSETSKTPLVGVDVEFETPSQNDLVIRTGTEPEEASFERLHAFVRTELSQLCN